MSEIDEIKDRIDIVEIIGETVKLRRTGKNYSGFCPFHSNTRTPAFVVFPETGTWRCFGACNEGGDIFRFVMKKEGWDFPEALRILAERAGVELRQRGRSQEGEEEHDRLREILETAVRFYHHQLMQSAAGTHALTYLRQRDLTDQTLETFELGYAPSGWDNTLRYMTSKGFKTEDLLATGLLSEKEGGRQYDRFRNRVMIPIRDHRGRMAGFGARVLDPDGVPKYLNSPQNVLFDKGRLLYGLDKSRKGIRSVDQAVIVEGYLDVIGLNQAGFQNAVSPMGTALNEYQLRTLKRFSRRIVLALDPDAAGEKGTLRGLVTAREALQHETDPVHDASGLLRYERRVDAEIRVASLPDGLDPDEIVADNPERWRRILEQAQPVVTYVFESLAAGKNLEDAKVKASIVQQIMPLIQDVSDRVERQAYRQQIARRLKLDERALQQSGPAPNRSRPRQRKVSSPEQKMPSISATMDITRSAEKFCLRALLQKPEILYTINREFQEIGLDRITSRDFSATERQLIFEAIEIALKQDDDIPATYCFDCMDEATLKLAGTIQNEVPELAFDHPGVRDEVFAGFLRLRKKRIDEFLHAVRFKLENSLQDDQMESAGRSQRAEREVLRYAQELGSLDRALARYRGLTQDNSSDLRR